MLKVRIEDILFSTSCVVPVYVEYAVLRNWRVIYLGAVGGPKRAQVVFLTGGFDCLQTLVVLGFHRFLYKIRLEFRF